MAFDAEQSFGEPGIDFNHPIFVRLRIKRKLNVALANNPQMSNNADGELPKQMIFAVRESLAGRHDNAFTRMDPNRVNVLHVADGDAIVRFVSNNFVFHFLPSIEEFFHKHLRPIRQRLLDPFRTAPSSTHRPEPKPPSANAILSITG